MKIFVKSQKNKMHLRLVFVVMFFQFFALDVSSQSVFPINNFSGQVVTTAHGTFTDSGIGRETHYNANETYHVTFCSIEPDSSVVQLHFNNFRLGAGDVVSIFDGKAPDAPLLLEATGNQLHGQFVHSSGRCLQVRFVSSPTMQDVGWEASIRNLQICETFIASILPRAGSFDACRSARELIFDATSSFASNQPGFDPRLVNYSWTIGNQVFQGPMLSRIFELPGAYPITLTATDPSTGCIAIRRELIRISTEPSFDGTFAPDTICATESFNLLGKATQTTWTGFAASVVQTAPIPDAPGVFYQSQLNFNIFQPSSFILSANDIQKVCVTLEHEVSGQVQIELECPAGNRMLLKDFSAQGANLGEPVVWDATMPGKGYQYCFVNEAAFGKMNETSPRFHSYTDLAGNFYFNSPFLPIGNYTPENSFGMLAACPLNGTWTLRIRDNQPGDNGFVFGWSLLFRNELYPDSLIFTPQTTRNQWFMGNTPIAGNPARTTISEPGNHVFRFETTNNFGCSKDTSVVVHVRRLPRVEILSSLTLPKCQGDSTQLIASPIGNLPENLSFQWFRDATALPGITNDTIWAKQPGLYSVKITDNATQCVNFFELRVTDQNCDLTIPNVFTPNFDGVNDKFEILNLEHYSASIVIFNRWGRKVFEHSDYYNNWWDGGNAPAGTYYYILTYTRGNQTRTSEGVITLIR